jgi:hypothetical protein
MGEHLGRITRISPDVAELTPDLKSFCEEVGRLAAGSGDEAVRSAGIEALRARLLVSKKAPSMERLKLLLVSNVLLDLAAQGWTVTTPGGALELIAPENGQGSQLDVKDRIRKQHLQERDAQLREPSVQQFVRSMERRRLTKKGWHSIYSVMRDGAELANSLRLARKEAEPERRRKLLAQVIDPYIQFVDATAVCPETGLRLNDIWRYFRHTWVNSYRSIPGRSMMLLVRDRARPSHPVIGIAALGSSVVQQSVRDKWIGWDSESATESVCSQPTRKKVRWMLDRLAERIDGIYKADLIKKGFIRSAGIRRPEEEDIKRLEEESREAIKRHRRYPDKSQLKSNGDVRSGEWKKIAQTDLFLSKRCKQLSVLLSIRKCFHDHRLDKRTLSELREIMNAPALRRSVGQLIRQLKAEHVGICMMDITVCGAVAPYNAILGGKLICHLLCSPEVVQAYKQRYQEQVSVIASGMRGTKVRRAPKLVLLCTTSLYGTGSSQYNRIKFAADQVGGKSEDTMAFLELGKSQGFGSFHFSKETVRIAHALLGRFENGRKVNSIFGEGVNPLMRKMREALTVVGLPSELLLKHGNKRIVYGIPLARNFREVLLGMEERPSYMIPQSAPRETTKTLGQIWRDRWLSGRIMNDDVLAQVAKHTLSFPVRHGAQVILQQDESDNSELLASNLAS